MKLQLIRSATLRITYGNHCFLIDPYLGEKFSGPSYAGKSNSPLVDLPFSINEIISGVDMVLVSHLHSDHFDPAAQAFLPEEMPLLCQSEDELKVKNMGFKCVYPIKEKYDWNGICIQRIPGKHGTGEVLKEMGIASGFLFEANGEPSIYWIGDTILCDEVRDVIARKKPKIIITHSCGAEWGNHVKIVMDEIQTIEVCKMAPRSIVIATHMDAVDHATVLRNSLREYARRNGIKDEQLIIPNDGETVSFTL